MLLPLLVSAADPPRLALIVPADTAKSAAVSTPVVLVMLPLVRVTRSTVSLLSPRSSVPPLMVTVLLSGKVLVGWPSVRVPPMIVVLALNVLTA